MSAFLLIGSVRIGHNTSIAVGVTVVLCVVVLLSFTTVWTENVGPFSKETATNQRGSTPLTSKTIVVPMTIFEGNITRTTNTCDRFCARETFLGEQSSKAFGAIRMFITRCESLTSQRILTVRTCETLAMPRLILVGDTPLLDHLKATRAFRRKMFLVARHAEILLIFRNETLRTDGLRARRTGEAMLMKLLPAIFEFLRAWLEDLIAFVTARCKLLIVTFTTVELLIFAAERFVDQCCFAHRTEETFLVPVTVFVREILGVGTDLLPAFFTCISKPIFVAFNTVRTFVFEDVA